MKTTQVTPVHVDAIRAPLDTDLASAMHSIEQSIRKMDAILGGNLDGKVIRTHSVILTEARLAVALDEQSNAFTRYLDEHERANEKLLRAMGAIAALDALYEMTGGWTRFWLVPDGHVHGDQHCPTLHREGKRTTLNWVPDLAGHTEAEAVEEFGESMCTVCFPSAPANPAFNGPGRRAQGQVDAKQAEKAERDAAKAAQAITNPDGTPLKLTGRFGDTIKTLITAAIAHKTGRTEDDIRTQAQTKADKKIAKELKAVKK